MKGAGERPPAGGGPRGEELGTRVPRAAAHPREIARALEGLTTGPGECSEAAVGRGEGGGCSARPVLVAITRFVEALPPGGARRQKGGGGAPPLPAPVARAAEALGCSSEACVVTHPKFREFAAGPKAGGDPLPPRLLEETVARNFKTAGPRDSTALLSNFDIDGVLQEWAAGPFPGFYNFPFAMIDFERTGGALARTDAGRILTGEAPQDLGPRGGVVRRPCRTFACVLNTDVSTGRGKHWVALFGDCRGRRGWTVEYFNSAGNPPPPPVTRWLEQTAGRLASFREAHLREFGDGPVEAEVLTDVRHQDSQTECGNYSLYFIRRRLEGAPPGDFRGARIPDEAMVEFRRHLFRQPH